MILKEINNVCPVPLDLNLPEIVFKYRAVNEYLLPSLQKNQIWLAKPDSFNDPFEPERIFSYSAFADELARNVREAGVLCLCKRNNNLAMWSYYGDALKGLTIGYDLAVLVRDLKPVEPSSDELSQRCRYVYDLEYRDDGLSLIQEMDLLTTDENRGREYQKMFATKAAVFHHEDGCRVVVPPSPDSRPEWSPWSGHGLYQYALEAVKEIIFGELMPEQDRQAVLEIMEGRDIKFFNAVRDKTSFRIRVE
jgi:hypothetical protein